MEIVNIIFKNTQGMRDFKSKQNIVPIFKNK